jgi:methylmalonyl-CoA/ethylmalonyl-CoA epimerase
MTKCIDHIGIAVESLEVAKKFWVDTLGLKYLRTEDVPEQKVRIAILSAGNATVELLEPTADDSPVRKFLDKRGEGLHHLAFAAGNLVAQLQSLKTANVELIDKEPRVGAGGTQIAFIHPKSAHGVLIELCERHD